MSLGRSRAHGQPPPTVIYATGYRISLPFLSSSLMTPRGRDLALYRRIAPPSIGGLFLAGFLDAPGGLLPVVETQGEWIAAVLTGCLRLPTPERMWRAIHRGERRTRQRFPEESLTAFAAIPTLTGGCCAPISAEHRHDGSWSRSKVCHRRCDLSPTRGIFSVQMAVEEVDSHGYRLLNCVGVVGHNVASPGKVVGLH